LDTATSLMALGLLSALFGGCFMIRIVTYLKSRGEPVSFFLFRLRWFHYMRRYRELTVLNDGVPGASLIWYKISMITALVLVIAGALINGG